MKPHQALDIIHAAIESETGISAFSNGTGAMCWEDENCGKCRKNLGVTNPDKFEAEQCKDGTLAVTKSGLHCFGEYAFGVGCLTGKIPEEIVEWMGGKDRMPEQCRFFTDDENYDPENMPDPVDPRQLKIPFMCVELFGFDDPNVLVFDKAIIEKDIYALTAAK